MSLDDLQTLAGPPRFKNPQNRFYESCARTMRAKAKAIDAPAWCDFGRVAVANQNPKARMDNRADAQWQENPSETNGAAWAQKAARTKSRFLYFSQLGCSNRCKQRTVDLWHFCLTRITGMVVCARKSSIKLARSLWNAVCWFVSACGVTAYSCWDSVSGCGDATMPTIRQESGRAGRWSKHRSGPQANRPRPNSPLRTGSICRARAEVVGHLVRNPPRCACRIPESYHSNTTLP